PSSERRTRIFSRNVALRNGTAPNNSAPIWRGEHFACLHFLQSGWIRGRFDPHREEGAEKEKARAPKLGRSEPFAEKDRRQSESARRANELQGLGDRDPDFLDRHVIQNVGETDTGDGGNDEDEVYAGIDAQRRFDSSKHNREWQEEQRRDETNDAETADRTEHGGRPFHQN